MQILEFYYTGKKYMWRVDISTHKNFNSEPVLHADLLRYGNFNFENCLVQIKFLEEIKINVFERKILTEKRSSSRPILNPASEIIIEFTKICKIYPKIFDSGRPQITPFLTYKVFKGEVYERMLMQNPFILTCDFPIFETTDLTGHAITVLPESCCIC